MGTPHDTVELPSADGRRGSNGKAGSEYRENDPEWEESAQIRQITAMRIGE
jgi:hypothetical protein